MSLENSYITITDTGEGVRPLVDTTSVLRLLTFALGAVAALWIVMSFTYPFGWDQGIFAWVGNAIVHGGLPYKDAWDIKGPLVYYLFALAQALFGIHLWSIRILDLALLLLATFSISQIGSELADKATGRWTAAFFFLWYASHSFWHTAQPDGWAGMILILALLPWIRRSDLPGIATIFLTGFCVGLITLFKPLYAAFLLLPWIPVVLAREAGKIYRSFVLTAGWVVPVALTGVWFAAHHALDQLIDIHFRWSAAYVAVTQGNRIRGLVEYLLTSRVIAVILPIVAYGVFVLWSRRRPIAIMLGAWTILVVFAVTAQNRFFAYHWLPLLPPVALLTTIGLREVWSKLPTLGLLFSLVLLVHCIAPIILEEARFMSWVVGRMDRETYYQGYGEAGDDMRAVSWLHRQSPAGNIFVFGWNASVGWLSERTTVSRFGYSMPLLFNDGQGARDRYRHELLDAMHTHPPRFVVVGTQSGQILGEPAAIEDFPEFADLVRQDYRQVAHYGNLTIHEFSGQPGSAAAN